MNCPINFYRATLPLTETKDKNECMCPHLTNLNHNNCNNAGVSATNAVTDLSNLSNIDATTAAAAITTPSSTTTSAYCDCDEHCTYNNGLNQNGSSDNNVGININEDSPRRHNSMDRLMGLLNDMGRTQRTRSLSDGGQEEGNCHNSSPH